MCTLQCCFLFVFTGKSLSFDSPDGEDSVLLTSPVVNITDNKCLYVWWYFSHTDDVNHVGLQVSFISTLFNR